MTPLAGLLALLGTINLLLGTKLVLLALEEEAVGAPRAAWEAALPRSIVNLTGRPPIEAYAEITAHPVFYRSREPFVPPPPAPPRPLPMPAVPPPVVATDPGLLLGGVMINGRMSKAYLLSKGGPGGGSWVNENETYQGWRVKTIDGSGVRIEQAGRAIELQLYPN
ncbi:exported hypothetical protein [Bradyrhizobium oligotrophicum S58]|uniref:Type II secretion system protein GspC N-terminal domain-containing protein n=1 Tax=Bradyrhizobium oligotrophicum S58 TaxID=1245469 RepID=M4ZDR9_9BRAD|nr:hypothetical protein [Bradyrhizobium oligotrophicum]BAM91973.1 exported hypothetical protein [Bradyrhizobium oligotrophicum S58]